MNYEFKGNIRAYAYGAGGPGTVYLAAAERGTFTISNQTITAGNGWENIFSNLVIESGGTLELGGSYEGAPTTSSNCILRATNITINAGGKISTTGYGWGYHNGPGAGDQYNLGGSHSGKGKNNPTTYGNVTNPVTSGSGGHWVEGGGAIRLIVADTLIVDGTIEANGEGSGGNYGGDGGGSIWIDTQIFTGSGTVQANAGISGLGGGGGRIAIYYAYKSSTFDGLPAPGTYTNMQSISTNVSVKGGYDILIDGPEDGSIYIHEYQAPAGTVIVIQ